VAQLAAGLLLLSFIYNRQFGVNGYDAGKGEKRASRHCRGIRIIENN
jgi:hypothetical protein